MSGTVHTKQLQTQPRIEVSGDSLIAKVPTITYLNISLHVHNLLSLLYRLFGQKSKFCVTLVQHNIPLAFADHMSHMIREVFHGEIAKRYSCLKTRTTCILNKAVAPEMKKHLVQVMQSQPYSLASMDPATLELKK